MGQTSFSAQRDRLAFRLAELSRRLSNPTPDNVKLVQSELDRLARG